MRVNIYTGNHNNSVTITDLVYLLRGGVRDCGYDVSISHDLLPGGCNIFIEHFIDDTQLLRLIDAKTPGTRYVLVGSERLTGNTFNRGLAAKDTHYGNESYWKTRFDNFMVAAQLADAVWVLAESEVQTYAAALPDKPVRFLPHGYVNDFAQVQHRPDAKKDIDFFFSGSMTDHRREIMNALAKKHLVVYNPMHTADYLRMDLMSRAKICLSMRISPDNDLPSVSRMHFHIQNGNFLLHEAYAKGSPLDPYVLKVPPEDFVEWAGYALNLPNRGELADGLLSRFKAEMPMTRWLAPMLADAMGAGTPQAAREPMLQVA
jgi:hypothetical protein